MRIGWGKNRKRFQIFFKIKWYTSHISDERTGSSKELNISEISRIRKTSYFRFMNVDCMARWFCSNDVNERNKVLWYDVTISTRYPNLYRKLCRTSLPRFSKWNRFTQLYNKFHLLSMKKEYIHKSRLTKKGSIQRFILKWWWQIL